MKTAVLVFCITLCLASSFALSLSEARTQFLGFQRNFNKTYGSSAEFKKRFQIFQDNMVKAAEHQKKNPLARFGVTKFSDLTEEEFSQYKMTKGLFKDYVAPPAKTEFSTVKTRNVAAPDPTNYDWSASGCVTPVYDQGQCGSCWAFSTIGNLEGVWFLAGHSLTSLSEQELVDCSTTSYGCGGGWPFWAYGDLEKAPAQGRIDTESGYPYVAENQQCSFKSNVVGATYKSYKSYCTEQTAACSEVQMQQLLVTYGPLSACLDATPMQFYQGGVDNPTNCDPNAIDHCITIVGYGTQNGQNFWKIKNSWSTTWGEQGYYYLIRGIGACGINKVITIGSTN